MSVVDPYLQQLIEEGASGLPITLPSSSISPDDISSQGKPEGYALRVGNTGLLEIGQVDFGDLSGVPSTYIPASHASTHESGGADELSISETQIPDGSILARIAASETISGSWTFSAQDLTLSHTDARILLEDTQTGFRKRSSDNSVSIWGKNHIRFYLDVNANNSSFFELYADVAEGTTTGTKFRINESGIVRIGVWEGTQIANAYVADLPTSKITSGTWGNAFITQSSVTQHQAALVILESQITDGSILARLASAETVSGTWKFSRSNSTAQNIIIETIDVTSGETILSIRTLPVVDNTISGNVLGRLAFGGKANTVGVLSSYIDAVATQTWSASVRGSKIRVFTTPDGSTTSAEIWNFSQAGHLLPVGTREIGVSGTRVSVVFATTINATNTTFNGVAYTWPGSDGTSGQILSTNGSGVLSWISSSAPSAHALVSATHTASGLTTGHVLRATAATTFAFQQLNSNDITFNGISYTFPGADGSSGQLLSTNGSGTLSWISASAPAAHGLVSATHTVSGLTTNHVLAALSSTTFGFQQILFSHIGGSIADSQVPSSAITQHESSLTILESQITDASILARIAANESISGQWTFTSRVDIDLASSNNFVLFYNTTHDRGLKLRSVSTLNAPFSLLPVDTSNTNLFSDELIYLYTEQSWKFDRHLIVGGNLTLDGSAPEINLNSVNQGIRYVTGGGTAIEIFATNSIKLYIDSNNDTAGTAALEIHADVAKGGDNIVFKILESGVVIMGTWQGTEIASAYIANLDASKITSGTFADARISQSSVTQHQAALTIFETQITDGSVYARLAGSETITTKWLFDIALSSGPILELEGVNNTHGLKFEKTIDNDANVKIFPYNNTGLLTGKEFYYDHLQDRWYLGSVLYIGVGSNNFVWHTGNVGAGSTLDADLLDGAQGTFYLNRSNHTGTISESDITDDTILARVGSDEVITGHYEFQKGDSVDIIEFKNTDRNNRTIKIRSTANDARPIRFLPEDNGVSLTNHYFSFDFVVLRWRFDSTPYVGTDKIWHAGNHGNGTGLDADLLDGSHASAFALVSHNHDTGDITSGTFADSRIASSNITQHQASLTILESQITDGSILARVAGTETITGTWNYKRIQVNGSDDNYGIDFGGTQTGTGNKQILHIHPTLDITVDTVKMINIAPTINTGKTITTFRAISISNPTGSGNITHNAALVIETQTKGGTTNKAIHVQGGEVDIDDNLKVATEIDIDSSGGVLKINGDQVLKAAIGPWSVAGLSARTLNVTDDLTDCCRAVRGLITDLRAHGLLS